MSIGINPVALRAAKWHEYAIRFFFGGLITVATGLIAQKFGPAVGGLFLDFPGNFPSHSHADRLSRKGEKTTRRPRRHSARPRRSRSRISRDSP